MSYFRLRSIRCGTAKLDNKDCCTHEILKIEKVLQKKKLMRLAGDKFPAQIYKHCSIFTKGNDCKRFKRKIFLDNGSKMLRYEILHLTVCKFEDRYNCEFRSLEMEKL